MAFIKRDLRRAAAFLWITPLAAALSMCFIAVATATWSSTWVNADLVRVLSSDLTDLLRTRRFSFCRLRLIWLLILATVSPESSCVDR